MLKNGQVLTCEISKEKLTIQKKLGEGGQGIVYLVEVKNRLMALKWYNKLQSTPEQKKNVRQLILDGPPKGEAQHRFVWPLDIVMQKSTGDFGYLMPLIDTQKYAQLAEVFAHIKPIPSAYAKCKISESLANSYRQLHLEGRCYRDISAGNLMFHATTGDILICDNDNVGVENKSKCQVNGTMEYMAPELIKGKALPSAKTDLYALSVLLFYLWMWHHPLHGLREYQIRSWDIPAKISVYGDNPVFIFDPVNASNRLPDDPEYNTPRKFWRYCPEPLKKLFIKAFTVGLKNPNDRVTEGEWQNLFLELADCIVPCPHDGAENFWYPGLRDMHCWYCQRKMDVPIRLFLKTNSGNRYVMMTRHAKLYERHLHLYAEGSNRNNPIGELIQNPHQASVWGLKNLSKNKWIVKTAEGKVTEVSPEKSVLLGRNIEINFLNGAVGIFEK